MSAASYGRTAEELEDDRRNEAIEEMVRTVPEDLLPHDVRARIQRERDYTTRTLADASAEWSRARRAELGLPARPLPYPGRPPLVRSRTILPEPLPMDPESQNRRLARVVSPVDMAWGANNPRGPDYGARGGKKTRSRSRKTKSRSRKTKSKSRSRSRKTKSKRK